MWATEDTPILQPKTNGSGIMVSDFVEQHSDSQTLSMPLQKQKVQKTARVLLVEYGADREGYCMSKKVLANIKEATQTVKFKYPNDEHTIVWLFDYSSCNRVFTDNAFKAEVMNVKPGGTQPCMRDIMWAGRVQKMVKMILAICITGA